MRPRNGILIPCFRCQEPIYRRPSDNPAAKRKFCSVFCHKKWLTEQPIESRFWPFVNKTETCWLWTGPKWNTAPKMNYGSLYCGRDTFCKHIRKLAHRISWEIHNGPIPNGLLVLHHCDVTLCVRPDHLFLGTTKDNAQDRQRKGRGHNQYI
jgi:hypothetical protein